MVGNHLVERRGESGRHLRTQPESRYITHLTTLTLHSAQMFGGVEQGLCAALIDELLDLASVTSVSTCFVVFGLVFGANPILWVSICEWHLDVRRGVGNRLTDPTPE